jgi:hypothetical protein
MLLDPRFKSLKLIYSFIGCEHRVAITKKYDRKSWFLMLLKSYHDLHPLLHANVPLFTKLMKIAIFEMVVNTSELAKEFVIP